MKMPYRTTNRAPALLAAAALVLPLSSCITVESPDKPIEINLNVAIRQEVLVRLQEEADRLIRQNPDAFPQTRPQGQR